MPSAIRWHTGPQHCNPRPLSKPSDLQGQEEGNLTCAEPKSSEGSEALHAFFYLILQTSPPAIGYCSHFIDEKLRPRKSEIELPSGYRAGTWQRWTWTWVSRTQKPIPFLVLRIIQHVVHFQSPAPLMWAIAALTVLLSNCHGNSLCRKKNWGCQKRPRPRMFSARKKWFPSVTAFIMEWIY